MPAIKHDALLLRLVKDINDIKAALRRNVANLPLFDIDNENTPATLSSNQNNYPPGNYDVLQLASTTSVRVSGFTGGVKGRKLRIFNAGNYPIVFTNQDSNSSAPNRLKINYNKILFPNETVWFYYNSTISRWVIISEKLVQYNIQEWGLSASVDNVSWNGVCWSPELGLFCAVAFLGTNRIMTSPDGLTWTNRTAPAYSYNDVCWSPELGLFCAGASANGRIATSPNGITWTGQTVPAGTVFGVTWSPELGIFCAVGTNRVYTSPDGTNWTSQTPPNANQWNSVCWSPELNLFCAVSINGTNRTATSPDGIVWTPSASANESSVWYDVCWSPELGMFCAVAATDATANPGTNQIMTSTNGTSWTSRNSPLYPPTDALGGFGNVRWKGIAWSPELGLFVACGEGQNNNSFNIMTSPDGLIWTGSYNIADHSLSMNAVTWSPDLIKFCVVGADTAILGV